MHGSLRKVCSAAIAIGALAASIPARADPIYVTINSGSAEGGRPFQSGPITIRGDFGFSLNGLLGSSGNFQPFLCCFLPGTTLTFGGLWVDSDVPNTDVTILGQAFTNVGSAAFPGGINLQFDSEPVTLPPLTAEATLQAPFSFRGRFIGPPETPPLERIMAELTGSGVGTLFLRGNSDVGAWLPQGARFDFTDQQAVPEPSTMLLTGGALLSLFGLNKRRRRIPSSSAKR
jgi:hypothetical protein